MVVATGTASGKSLGYLLPALTAILEAADAGGVATPPRRCTSRPPRRWRPTSCGRSAALGLEAVRAATYDGDTPGEARDWVRQHAAYVLTNPDMLHRSILPGHPRWARFFRDLRYVVIDECHSYRGVFGSHVAAVLRRLRRICAHYGSHPTFVLASATVADPEVSGARLIGREVVPVTEDASPRGELLFALWEPPLTELAGENQAPVRRTRHRRGRRPAGRPGRRRRPHAGLRPLPAGRRAVASTTRRLLAEVDPELAGRVAAYRAGYLPEERRALEAALQSGRLLGVASTTALELGVDVAGLDAVLLAG